MQGKTVWRMTGTEEGDSLHARRVSFVHPVSKELIDVEAPLPDGNLWHGFQ